jgi:hypothetical protein
MRAACGPWTAGAGQCKFIPPRRQIFDLANGERWTLAAKGHRRPSSRTLQPCWGDPSPSLPRPMGDACEDEEPVDEPPVRGHRAPAVGPAPRADGRAT